MDLPMDFLPMSLLHMDLLPMDLPIGLLRMSLGTESTRDILNNRLIIIPPSSI